MACIWKCEVSILAANSASPLRPLAGDAGTSCWGQQGVALLRDGTRGQCRGYTKQTGHASLVKHPAHPIFGSIGMARPDIDHPAISIKQLCLMYKVGLWVNICIKHNNIPYLRIDG